MCGLNLILGNSRNPKDLRLLNKGLAHRGLPGRSTLNSYFGGRVQLGHVRLPIQGLDSENDHPQQYGNLVGAFVGEIFNFRTFYPGASSDLPVILKEFDKEGPGAFQQFDGFWAVVLINLVQGLVHVLTDFLAKKPLYIRYDQGAFLISSEIGPLFHYHTVTPDEIYFAGVAKFGYYPGNRTPFTEIKKIPPDTHLIYNVRDNSLIQQHYDKISPNKSDLRAVLKMAIKNRLISDVPISLLLSGGLDSTIIFELVKQETFDFTIFHVDNEEAEFLNYLKIPSVVRVIPLSLTHIQLEEALHLNETPVDLGSVLPQLALAKAIKEQGFYVAMSGDGADELFGGYRRAQEYDSQYSDIFHELVYYHLPRLDKLMMSQTIELRCPYLSRPVIETALTVPYEKRRSKEILRETFGDLVPKQILNRKKQPLRIAEMQENKMAWRLKLIKKFREMIWGQYVS
jgi:asparagine synthase (glutamine-hydrolysing)